MISKASLSNFVFLFLFSLLVHAEESSDIASVEAKAKDAEESQAIIEQVKEASETGSTTRFLMDYIGNISKTNGGEGSLVETLNNHRLNASYDYYKTRYFFYTPVFAEYYRDPFTNIDSKITYGAGLGYTVIDDGITELSFSGGPA